VERGRKVGMKKIILTPQRNLYSYLLSNSLCTVSVKNISLYAYEKISLPLSRAGIQNLSVA
jgi:hypothetical protein